MVSLWISIGLILATLGVASLGAYFSITGLAALFSGAALAVWLMAGSLEFAKFMLAAYLHQTWKQHNVVYKSYLTFAIVVLSVITSVGIYGFLSDAYQSASSLLEAETVKIESLKTQQSLVAAEISRLNKMVEEIPERRISRRLKLRAEIEPQILELNKKYNDGEKLLAASNLKIIDVRKKVGPLLYIAKMMNTSLDRVVNYLILLLVSVFDPLAICLVMATTNALESRRQRTKNEESSSASVSIVTNTSAPHPPGATEVIVSEKAVASENSQRYEQSSQAVVSDREEPLSDDVIVQMNFKDESEDKKAV